MGSYTMTLKAITTLLFACLVIHQTFGCQYETVRDDFKSMDKDKSGFLTRNEVFEACPSASVSEKECEKGWISMDLNNDGQVNCQESFVAAMAMIEGLQKGKAFPSKVGETLRRIFADKPENCDEVSKEEVEKFALTALNDNSFANKQFVDNFQNYHDANQDGIITCYEFLERFYLSIVQIEKKIYPE